MFDETCDLTDEDAQEATVRACCSVNPGIIIVGISRTASKSHFEFFMTSGRMSRWPCKDYLKGTCTNSLCEKSGSLQNACSTRPRVVADLGEKCSRAHRQVDEQPSKRSKKNGDKSAVAMLKKNEHHHRTG